MVLFMTSSPGGFRREGDRYVPCELDGRNGFIDNLKRFWPERARVLLVSAAPDLFELNDAQQANFTRSLPMSGLPVSRVDVCDSRAPTLSPADYGVVILGGGHVPTQNTFFAQIGLKEKLRGFDGVVIGVSAGTMNSAATVYAQPELEGEAVDPDYRRFIPGLGLTDYMVVPHYQMIRDDVLDGLRLIDEITLPDSAGRRFYLLPDGSYILQTASSATLYGEAYLAEDQSLNQICQEGESLSLQ